MLAALIFIPAMAVLNKARGNTISPGIPNAWVIWLLKTVRLDNVAARIDPAKRWPRGGVAAPFLMGCGTCVYALFQGYDAGMLTKIFFVSWAGLTTWAVRGWGLYFACVSGVWREHEKEVLFIDKIGLKLVPFVSETDAKSNQLRGTICMSLRGFFFALPMFVGFAWLLGPWVMLESFLFLLQGPVYRAWASMERRGGDGIAHAEWSWGACMGAILAIILMSGMK